MYKYDLNGRDVTTQKDLGGVCVLYRGGEEGKNGRSRGEVYSRKEAAQSSVLILAVTG